MQEFRSQHFNKPASVLTPKEQAKYGASSLQCSPSLKSKSKALKESLASERLKLSKSRQPGKIV